MASFNSEYIKLFQSLLNLDNNILSIVLNRSQRMFGTSSSGAQLNYTFKEGLSDDSVKFIAAQNSNLKIMEYMYKHSDDHEQDLKVIDDIKNTKSFIHKVSVRLDYCLQLLKERLRAKNILPEFVSTDLVAKVRYSLPSYTYESKPYKIPFWLMNVYILLFLNGNMLMVENTRDLKTSILFNSTLVSVYLMEYDYSLPCLWLEKRGNSFRACFSLKLVYTVDMIRTLLSKITLHDQLESETLATEISTDQYLSSVSWMNPYDFSFLIPGTVPNPVKSYDNYITKADDLTVRRREQISFNLLGGINNVRIPKAMVEELSKRMNFKIMNDELQFTDKTYIQNLKLPADLCRILIFLERAEIYTNDQLIELFQRFFTIYRYKQHGKSYDFKSQLAFLCALIHCNMYIESEDRKQSPIYVEYDKPAYLLGFGFTLKYIERNHALDFSIDSKSDPYDALEVEHKKQLIADDEEEARIAKIKRMEYEKRLVEEEQKRVEQLQKVERLKKPKIDRLKRELYKLEELHKGKNLVHVSEPKLAPGNNKGIQTHHYQRIYNKPEKHDEAKAKLSPMLSEFIVRAMEKKRNVGKNRVKSEEMPVENRDRTYDDVQQKYKKVVKKTYTEAKLNGARSKFWVLHEQDKEIKRQAREIERKDSEDRRKSEKGARIKLIDVAKKEADAEQKRRIKELDNARREAASEEEKERKKQIKDAIDKQEEERKRRHQSLENAKRKEKEENQKDRYDAIALEEHAREENMEKADHRALAKLLLNANMKQNEEKAERERLQKEQEERERVRKEEQERVQKEEQERLKKEKERKEAWQRFLKQRAETEARLKEERETREAKEREEKKKADEERQKQLEDSRNARKLAIAREKEWKEKLDKHNAARKQKRQDADEKARELQKELATIRANTKKAKDAERKTLLESMRRKRSRERRLPKDFKMLSMDDIEKLNIKIAKKSDGFVFLKILHVYEIDSLISAVSGDGFIRVPNDPNYKIEYPLNTLKNIKYKYPKIHFKIFSRDNVIKEKKEDTDAEVNIILYETSRNTHYMVAETVEHDSLDIFYSNYRVITNITNPDRSPSLELSSYKSRGHGIRSRIRQTWHNVRDAIRKAFRITATPQASPQAFYLKRRNSSEAHKHLGEGRYTSFPNPVKADERAKKDTKKEVKQEAKQEAQSRRAETPVETKQEAKHEAQSRRVEAPVEAKQEAKKESKVSKRAKRNKKTLLDKFVELFHGRQPTVYNAVPRYRQKLQSQPTRQPPENPTAATLSLTPENLSAATLPLRSLTPDPNT